MRAYLIIFLSGQLRSDSLKIIIVFAKERKLKFCPWGEHGSRFDFIVSIQKLNNGRLNQLGAALTCFETLPVEFSLTWPCGFVMQKDVVDLDCVVEVITNDGFLRRIVLAQGCLGNQI